MPQVLTYKGEKPDGSERGIAVSESDRLPTQDGDTSEILLHDKYTVELFEGILRELKILNTRFEEAFRTDIKEEDVDGFY